MSSVDPFYKLDPFYKPQSTSRALALRVLAGLAAVFLVHRVHGALVHQYELNGSYSDVLGGPSLLPGGINGRGILDSTHYTFAAGQGLSLAGALPNLASYSILLDFSFTTVTSYRKIVDFADRSLDAGVYNLRLPSTFTRWVVARRRPFSRTSFVA